MTRAKKIELAATMEPETTIKFTAKDIVELTQSYAALAEHTTRIARIMGRTIGISEDTIVPGALNSDSLLNGAEADGKKRKRDRDPDAPKRPPSSFLLFMADRRPVIKKEHPTMNYTELMKEIGSMWKALPESQRMEYEDRYNKSRTEFQKQQETYQAKKTAESDKRVKTTAAAPASDSDSDSTEGEDEKPTPTPTPPAKSRKHVKPAPVSDSENSDLEPTVPVKKTKKPAKTPEKKPAKKATPKTDKADTPSKKAKKVKKAGKA